MENPLQILRDALEIIGLDWEEMLLVMAGISHPMAILDMAEWVAEHPEATLEDLMEIGTTLVEQYQVQEN